MTSPDAPPAPASFGPVRRLYNWVVSWAESPHAAWALFWISFAESSFFPIPPDVLLIALVLGKPSRAFRFALICTAGSVLGGLAGYVIGAGFWEATQNLFYKIPGITPEGFEAMSRRYDEYGLWIVFIAAFTPIPYKLITVSAGVFHISLLPFIGASIVGRAARFYLVAEILRRFGPWAQPYIEKHFEKFALAFGVLLVGGFAAVKLLH